MASAGVMLIPVGDEPPEPLIPEPYLYEEFIAPDNSFGIGDTTFKTVNWSYFQDFFNEAFGKRVKYKLNDVWHLGNQYLTIDKHGMKVVFGNLTLLLIYLLMFKGLTLRFIAIELYLIILKEMSMRFGLMHLFLILMKPIV